jgi:hypothetical protein
MFRVNFDKFIIVDDLNQPLKGWTKFKLNFCNTFKKVYYIYKDAKRTS